MSTVAEKITAAITNAGSYTSLCKLALELDINYSHGYHVVKELNNKGHLIVTKTRGRGMPLKLEICPKGAIQNGNIANEKRQTTN